MASALANMTKEEKDEMVQRKMEDMKKKSEEILKRHLQIEADKKNADVYSKAVIERKKSNPTPEVPKEKRPHNRQTSKHQLIMRADSREMEEKRKQRLSDGDAPPPDPNFNFLSDPSRQNDETFNDPEMEKKEPGFRHKNNFGGEDFQNVKTSIKQQRNYAKEHPMSPPKNKMEMTLKMTGKERRDYETWRKEREQIDKERIARQKTSEGTWKREWDNNKITQVNDMAPRKPDEYYKAPQWNKDEKPGRGNKSRITFSRGRGNSGRFRGGRDTHFSNPEWEEEESAKPNHFTKNESRQNFLDKTFDNEGGKHMERNPSKAPLYPGWEHKRNFEHFSKGDGFKKWDNKDGRTGRRSDAPSWRSGQNESDSITSHNFLSREEKSDTKWGASPTSTSSGWEASPDAHLTDADNWKDVQPEGPTCEIGQTNKKNSQDEDHKDEDLEGLNLEAVDLSSVKNIVIKCSGKNRNVKVEGVSSTSKEESLEENDEDGWEDVSGEEEEVDGGSSGKNETMSYENLRTVLNAEIREVEEMQDVKKVKSSQVEVLEKAT